MTNLFYTSMCSWAHPCITQGLGLFVTPAPFSRKCPAHLAHWITLRSSTHKGLWLSQLRESSRGESLQGLSAIPAALKLLLWPWQSWPCPSALLPLRTLSMGSARKTSPWERHNGSRSWERIKIDSLQVSKEHILRIWAGDYSAKMTSKAQAQN